MHKSFLALAAVLVASAAPADTLVTNVNGIQAEPDGTIDHFKAFVIGKDGKIIQVLRGADDGIARHDRIVDLNGATVLPGMIDAHGHVTDLGFAALSLDLVGTSSVQDLQQRLKGYAAAHPHDGWLIGQGWNQELWADKNFPTAAELDAVVPDRPVVLERVDGHAMVANSAALRAAGITAATADPSGGRIERDSAGRPAGTLVDAATGLVRKVISSPTWAQQDEALAKAQEILLGYGVTGVGAMSTSLADWSTYRRAGDAGRLQVRLMTYALNGPFPELPRPTPWLYGDRLKMGGIKLFADGALGSRGAFLKQPYADKPDTRGLQFHSDAELLAMADRGAAAGFQIATHAIGDAANAQIISVYEKLSRKYGRDRRWRIEHFQIVDPVDIPRLAPAGIIASMQPTHQTSDRLMAEARLGPSRLAGTYAWHSVLKSGARLAFGTDFPVESPNPFPGLSAGISRQDMTGQPPGGWIPSERLTLGEALRAYTRGAAYAGFAEDKIGALEPGKYADFIIVDRDPTKVDPQSLARTQVLETWIAGEKVWSRAVTASPTERGR